MWVWVWVCVLGCVGVGVCVCVCNMYQRDGVCTVYIRFKWGEIKIVGDCMHKIAFLILPTSSVAFLF